MKVNITGFLRNTMLPRSGGMIAEFLGHLKELRDAPSRHQEFFDLYIFSDDTEYRKKLIAPPKATEQGSVPDLRAVDKGISPAKRGCAGCIFYNRLESAEPCSSCDPETLSSFTSLQTKHSA